MVKISVMGDTPLEALASLTAFGMHCMQNADVYTAARHILEAEKQEEKKLAEATPASAQTQNGAAKPQQEAPGPAGGGNGPTPAPGDKRSPVPTGEQVRTKGIEASRKYGKEAVVAILQKFGASGMSAIAEKDRAAFLTELERLGEGDA